jgi:hypothetical protein
LDHDSALEIKHFGLERTSKKKRKEKKRNKKKREKLKPPHSRSILGSSILPCRRLAME